MTVTIVEARNKLSEYVRKAEEGQEVIIARHGKPAVRLVPAGRPPFSSTRGIIPLTPRQRAALDRIDWDAPAFPPMDPNAPIP